MSDRPHNYIEAAAIVSGPSALILAGFLDRYRREWREYAAPISKSQGLAVADTVEAIIKAAAVYRESVSARASSLGGSDERKLPEVSPDSVDMKWVSTSDAASLLGLSARRIRQLLLLEQLTGRRVNGRWQVSRLSVLERASR